MDLKIRKAIANIETESSGLSAQSVVSKGRSRLDRFVSRATNVPLREVQQQIARGDILVNGTLATAINQQVDQFTRVDVGSVTLAYETPVYLMMNKPKAVVSATKDNKHPTVIDLIDQQQKHQLHIVGRLDFNTTGLLLLTNDGHWSRGISLPESGFDKTYQVTLQHPVSEECIHAFEQGMHFEFENITTQPAAVRIISERRVEVTLHEGKYHQIKRMFGRFDNEVLELHRSGIGSVQLDPALSPGECRPLSAAEQLALTI